MFEEIEPPAHPTPNVKNKKMKLKIAVILASLGILALLGGGSYFLGTQTAPPGPTPTPNRFAYLTQNPPPVTHSPTPKTSTISGTIVKVTSSPTPIPKSLIITSTEELDGFRESNGGGNTNLEIRAGRNSNSVTRGFVAYDISKVPQGAKIETATLRLYQVKVVGDPYSAGNLLIIDHLTYGDTLDDSDYGLAALLSGFVTLASDKKAVWKEADVTIRIKDDIANARSQSQFRLHFTKELRGGDTDGDFVYFESGENIYSTNNIPQLIIKYF